MPRVTVVIPTYNRAALVPGAVASVLAQHYRDFEIVVVDDGSTDDTLSRLAWLRPPHRVVYREHRGVSAARNSGAALGDGALLAFLDSDDLWRPDKLGRQVEFFDARPTASLCQTDEIWVRNGRRVNPAERHRKPSGDIFAASCARCVVSPSAVLMRRAFFEALGGFDESLPACEDYDLWIRAACRSPVPLLRQALVVRRAGHGDQLSRSWGLDRWRVAALARLLAREPLAPERHTVAAREMARRCAVLARGAERRARRGEAAFYHALTHWALRDGDGVAAS